MPLDPQVVALYAGIPLGLAPGDDFTVEQARAHAAGELAQRAPGPAVHAVLDQTIPCEWGELPIRIYLPHSGPGLGVMLFFHGGGFVTHSIETHDSLCRKLALAGGAAVVSVGYRLAPENPLPAAIEDGYSALEWVRDHAASFGCDNNRIAVCGDSAGAHISAAVSIWARDRQGPRVSAQILCYGNFRCLPDDQSESVRIYGGGGYLLCDGMREWFARQRAPRVPGIAYMAPGQVENLADLPPALVITAECDPLRDDGEAFARRLEEAGNSVELERVPGMMHGFLSEWEHLDRAKETIERIGTYLQSIFA